MWLKRFSINNVYIYILILIFSIYFIAYIFQINKSNRPNVILITVDSLRADYFPCNQHSNKNLTLCNILNQDFIKFENAFSQSTGTPLSIPSLLTSKYPSQLGIYEFFYQAINPKTLTLFDVLKGKGYFTAVFTELSGICLLLKLKKLI